MKAEEIINLIIKKAIFDEGFKQELKSNPKKNI